jgi:PAS domain S-box-containing protein
MAKFCSFLTVPLSSTRIRRAFRLAMLLWIALVGASLFLNWRQAERSMSDLALIESRSSFNKDLVYRRWATMHGGVYVPPTDETPPNPHLSEVPNRDVETTTGKKLTLVNPAYMTRQVHELGREQYGTLGHITSLNPIRPENHADPWEMKSLEAFEIGYREVSSVEIMDGQPFLRFMQPMITEVGCLKCHTTQGYKLGDIRGGISVSVPLAPYLEAAGHQQVLFALGHGLIGVLGLLGLWLGGQALASSQEAMREGHERLELVLHGADLGSWDWNVTTGRVTFNERWAEMLGYALDEIDPHVSTWEKMIHPEDLSHVRMLLNTHLEGRSEFYETEHRLRHKLGHWVWVLDKGRVIERDAKNNPIRACGTHLDITERRQTAESLGLRESYLMALIENQPGLLWLKDTESRFLSVNQAFVRSCGRKRSEEVVGKTDLDIWPRELAEKYRQDDQEVMTRRTPIAVEERIFDQEVARWFQTFKTPVITADGQVLGTCGFALDVTERKRVEEAIARERTFSEDIIKSLPGIFYMYDDNGKLVRWNKKHEEATGYSSEEMLGIYVLDWFAEEHKQYILSRVQSVFAEGESFAEAPLLIKNGSQIPYFFTGRLAKLDGKQYLLGVGIDITERKRAELRMLQSEERLRLALKAADQGLYDLNVQTGDGQVSPEYATMLGYDPEVFQETRAAWIERLHPKDRETAVAIYHDYVAGKIPAYQVELRQRTKSGGWKWILSLGKIVEWDVQGKPLRMLGTHTDITVRKRAEEALRESEATLKSIVRVAPIGIGLVANRILKQVNDRLCNMLGYSREELIGETARILYPSQEEFEWVGKEKYLLIQECGTGTVETHWQHKDGRLVDILLSSTPLDPSDLSVGVTFTALDITERKRAEDLIRIRLSLLEFAAMHSLEEVLQKTLDEVGVLTGSPIGFYHFVESDQKTISLQAWSTRTLEEFCKAEGKGLHYPISRAGVWVDCVHERRPVIHNDYSALSHRKGLPEGHAPVIRELVVPIVRSDRILAILGIGNKPGNYTEQDVEVVSYLADVVWEIITRKRAEEALQESEKRYRRLFESANDGISLLGPTGCFVDCNENAAGMHGLLREDFIGRSPAELSQERQPDGRLSSEVATEKILAAFKGEPQSFEWQSLRADGVPLDVEIALNRVEMGGSFLVQAIVRDITERKRAEEARRLNESRLETLLQLNQMTDATLQEIASFAMEEAVRLTQSTIGYVAFMNEDETVLTMHAWSRAAMRECRIDDKPLDYPVEMTGLWGEAVRQRRPIITNDYQASNPLKRGTPPGHEAVLRHMNVPIFDGDRTVVVAGVGNKPTDYEEADVRQLTLLMTGMWRIIQRKRAEEALRESQERFQELAELLPETIFEMDADGQLTFVNQNAFAHFGYSVEDFEQGMNGFELLSPEDRPRALENTKRVMGGEKIGLSEYKALRNNGSTFPAILHSSAKFRDGEAVGIRGIVIDITETKKLETQLRQALKMEAVGTLAGGIAHDFNNLLQAVSGYAELLLFTKTQDDEGYRELLEIERAAKRGAELTRQLLTFSRTIESKLQLVDLNRIVEDVRLLLERTIPKMIRIELHLMGNLRAVHADASQMEQVLMNLAVNARDAMPDGGCLSIETKNVTLDDKYRRSHPELIPGNYVLLTVADTGHGMDETTLEHIFDPFFTTKEIGKGTGLGLAMVYGIVKNHSGYITCKSKPGEGTTFEVFLPSVEQFEKMPIIGPVTNGLFEGHETVLLVDDDEPVRGLGEMILRRFGYMVISAPDGESALQVYREQEDRIDLVILDLIMPGMGGRQCLKKILEINPQAKVVIASGYTIDGETARAKESGAKAFVSKPYNVQQMLKVVREVLD